MSQRFALLAAIAVALLFAGGVYAGKDRLMPAEQTPAMITESAPPDVAADGESAALEQVALPPLSPEERAATNRTVLSDSAEGVSAQAAEDWDDDAGEDDEHEEDEHEDDDRYEEHEDEDD